MSHIWAKLGATRCLAVVQGTIRSWVPVGFPSPAIRPMRDAGEVPKFLGWDYAEALSESVKEYLPWGCKKAAQRSGAASCGCWPATVYV